MNRNYLIFSADDEIINFYLQDILKKIKYNDTDRINIDLSVSKFDDVINEASIPSMFSSVKVIVAKNFEIDKVTEEEYSKLSKYLSSEINVYIILLANKIDARRKYYKLFKENFKVIGEEVKSSLNVKEYICDYVKENKYKFSDMDVDYFISLVGYNVNNIKNELDKLFLYKTEDKCITKDDIDLLINANIDDAMYEFTNAILDNNYDKVAIMYEKFTRDNVSFDYLISSIAGSIRTNLIIKILNKDGKSNIEIANIIGKKEYFVKKSLERLYQYTVDNLTNYLGELALIDRNFKSGKSNIDELELFILNK